MRTGLFHTNARGFFGRSAVLSLALLTSLSACAPMGAVHSVGTAQPAPTTVGEQELRRRARIRLELATNYLQNGQTDIALEEINQALATDANYADAYHLRAITLMNLKDFAQAEDNFRQAQRINPGDPDMLHNFGWLRCQLQQYEAAQALFAQALAVPSYTSRSKTLMSQGVCWQRAGQLPQAQESLQQAYEIDAGNPAIGYNLASVLFQRADAKRAQFYIRRVNNGEFSNAESLWLGLKVERALGDTVAQGQLAEQLRKRFPQARQTRSLESGAFNE